MLDAVFLMDANDLTDDLCCYLTRTDKYRGRVGVQKNAEIYRK